MGIRLPKRIPELDGFRGIAVLMVMIEHVYETAPTKVTFAGPVEFLLTHGWLGVDLFFVLSGFLITGILLDERDRVDYFQSFYRRRACRILPLAIACLIVYSLVSGSTDDHGYFIDFALTLLFCANLNVFFGVLPIPGTGVMWSLAVEEHFYLLWPLIIRRFSRRTVACLGAAIVLLSPIARGLAMRYGVHPQSVYQLSWFRFDGLAVGALLAIFVRSRYFTVRNTWCAALGWLALILIVTAFLVPYGVLKPKSALGESLRYTQAQGLFGAAMAVALVHQGSALTAVLRSRFLGWTAALSYCLYLVHMSVGSLYIWMLHRAGISNTGSLGALLLRYVAVFALSFALAILSGKYLEGPFLRIRARTRTIAAA
ncbi:MAG TPA: acyltransferase [Steroidobacteraceae bacterium]|jgi:peptidoglycan/LPS O-acetylase OafA/YrhL|nr:acyltransferase [Steroidobacteraceae bacterium]